MLLYLDRQADADTALMVQLVDVWQLGKEVGAALELVNISIVAEVEAAAHIGLRHLYAHEVVG